jgi:hypothetical protein
MRGFCRSARRLAVAVLLAAAGIASGDGLVLQLKLAHSQLLQFEPVVAFLSIQNDSAEPFLAAEDSPADIRFLVERRRDDAVGRTNAKPMVRHLRVMPGEKRDIMLDVSAWYDVSTIGGYFLNAEVAWNGTVYSSNRMRIEVVPGLTLSSTVKSLAAVGGEGRRYTLRYLARENAEYLFLCVEDEARTLSYGVFDLGRLLRVVKPRLWVDQQGTVNVIHQSAPTYFTRSVLETTPEGVRFVDQQYVTEDGKPLKATAPAPEAGADLGGSGPGIPITPAPPANGKDAPATPKGGEAEKPSVE